MLNTYIRDIYCNTYLHPENALRVPNLMEKLIGDRTGEIIDIWLPKLKASVYKIEDDDYGYIFRRSTDEILSTAFGDEYAHCWEQLRRVPDYIKNMERCLLGEDYNPDMFSLAIDLLPGTSCVVDDFTCGSRYTRWVKLYEFYDKFVNYYERNVSEEVESVKSEMYCSDKCIYTDTEGCSIGKLVDAIYSRALKRNDNIYDNWLQFCRLAQAWYAYLIKGTEIGGIPGLGMDICAYDSLISHDSVDYMAAAWLPNKNGNTSNKGRAKVNAKCIELFGDITEFLESSDETATEHDVAVNVVKTLAIGQELMQKGNRERVVKLLRQAFSWKTSVDTEKCKATMQAILESYIKERRKQHKATRAFEILMIGNN